MDVRTYLRAIRKSWWAVVLCVLLGGGAGFAYSEHATPVYAAHVQFFVGTAATASTDAQSSDQFAQSRAVSYAKLLSSGITVAAIAAHDRSIGLTPAQIGTEISGTAEINTVLIDATVEDTSKRRALRIARALTAVFPAVAQSVEPRNTTPTTSVVLHVSDPPSVGSTPVSPRTGLNILMGVAVGVVLGLLIAVIRFLRDTSIRTRDDVESIGGAPLLGDIVFDGGARTAPLVLEAQSHSLRGEAFRQLRTNLQFVDAAEALRVIVVTSSTEAEGKSTTAANLALTFAETGASVVLVGADLRRPRISEYLSVESAVGLTNVLVHQVSLDDALQPWGTDGLQVLASGAVPPNPSELLGSPHMRAVLEELRARFDLVIIDTPPLLPVTDAAVLAVHADGVVVVCRHGRTRRAQLASAVRSLTSVNARIVGMVLNMRPVRDPDSERYGSYQYYSEVPGRDGRFWRRAVRAERRASSPGPAINPFPTSTAPARRGTAQAETDPVTAPEPVPGTVAEPVPETVAGTAPQTVPDAVPETAPFDEQVGLRPQSRDALTPGAREAFTRRRARAARRSRMRLPGDGNDGAVAVFEPFPVDEAEVDEPAPAEEPTPTPAAQEDATEDVGGDATEDAADEATENPSDEATDDSEDDSEDSDGEPDTVNGTESANGANGSDGSNGAKRHRNGFRRYGPHVTAGR